jgi:hypothetical protein
MGLAKLMAAPMGRLIRIVVGMAWSQLRSTSVALGE